MLSIALALHPSSAHPGIRDVFLPLARSILLTALVLVGGKAAYAADASEFEMPLPVPEHTVWLDAYQSANEVRDYLLTLDLALTPVDRLQLGAGQSTIPTDGDGIDAQSFQAGYRTGRVPATELGLRYTYWGESDEFTVQSVQPELTWHHADWALGASGEYREFELFTRPILGTRYKGEFESSGYTLSLRYGPARGPTGALAAGRWDYSKDIRLLATARATFFISPRAQTLAGGLLDSREQAELGYRWARNGLSAVVTRDVSGIDQSRANTYALRWRLDPVHDWSFELEGGHLNAELGDDYNYGRVAVGYYWLAVTR
jgi:hypothetical protein